MDTEPRNNKHLMKIQWFPKMPLESEDSSVMSLLVTTRAGDFPLEPATSQRLPGKMTHRKRLFIDDLSIEHVDLPIENCHL